MQRDVNAGPPARRSTFPARPTRWLTRPRGPRRITIYLGVLGVLALVFDAATFLRRARRGPWRAEVAEDSMAPALRPGDWLLLDPTCRRWPRPGSIVVVHEPMTGILAIKRVAARGSRARRPGEMTRGAVRGPGGAAPPGRHPGEAAAPGEVSVLPDGAVEPLGPREAWLLGDATDGSIDSRRYGAVDADDLVARAWFRYGPSRRIGRLR